MPEKTAQPTHIVGIGASAGGLESIDAFFRQVSLNSGAAFVVVQHLSPDFKSLMDEIMARFTDLPIHRVEDEMPVEANSIYLIPPKKNMIISNSKLLLSDQQRTGELLLPIDLFFRSLAEDFGKQAIAVILSGTGSDGSRGILAVHEAGGFVLVQKPESAKFDGMPRAAIATEAADLAMIPSDMPKAIVKHMHGPRVVPPRQNVADKPLAGLDAVFELLREEFAIDFNHYRDSTVDRRLERRVEIARCITLDEYVGQLRRDPEELNSLYADLLIGTTQFFRDEQAWEYIEREVIPELFERAVKEERELRVWEAGCATGEESYTLAILLAEYAAKHQTNVPIKIFATDVHQRSIDRASDGWFAQNIEEQMSSERLERFFIRRGDEYRVRQEIRRMVIFAQQNLLTHAPFTNVDLTICRNLLIYFEILAQRKVLSLFHFSLRPNGVLFLGSSESLGDLADEFEVVSVEKKLFRKRRDVPLTHLGAVPIKTSSRRTADRRPAETTQRIRTDAIVKTAYEMALGEFVESGVLVDADLNLLHVFGNASSLMNMRPGPMSSNARDILPAELNPVMTAAIHRARREHINVRYERVRVTVTANAEEQERYLQVIVQPIIPKNASSQYFLILFGDAERSDNRSERDTITVGEAAARKSNLEDLESELQYTKENLQAANEELETSNEELQATNEELVAANEELQSTNEELQASNEELQSTNEELQSVNEELHTVSSEHQTRVVELTEVTADLETLLDNIDMGVAFLDGDLCIRRYTSAISRIIRMVPRDIGRPINHISHDLSIGPPELAKLCQQVMQTNEPLGRTVSSGDETWLALHVLPHLDDQQSSQGCVLTFFDITESRLREMDREKYTAKLEASNQDLQDFAYVASHDLKAPARNIAALCKCLAEEHSSQLDEDGQDYLNKMIDRSDRMQTLIGDLLKFSRVHSRGNDFESFDCNLAVDNALTALSAVIEETDAQITRSLLPTLDIDQSQITHLFQNLIANALNYQAGDQRPEISISAVHRNNEWCFAITDNGIGIEPKYFDRIFVIFKRLHSSEDYEGTGLGLAICKRIVERHGGRIWVESQPGHGSTFHFTVPLSTDVSNQELRSQTASAQED